MSAEKSTQSSGYAEAARLNISPETYEEMKEFFIEKAIPRIIQKKIEEKGMASEAIREG